MTCKDCLHFGICRFSFSVDGGIDIYDGESGLSEAEHLCGDFKDKEFCYQLPYRLGETIYIICAGKIAKNYIESIKFSKSSSEPLTIKTKCPRFEFCQATRPCVNEIQICVCYHSAADVGEALFFTREEAEKKVKELNEHENQKGD